MNERQKLKAMTRILCLWNRKGISADSAIYQIWKLYEKEVLETWNDPLEKLVVNLYRPKD